MIRRALSSQSGFLGFLERGFGRSGLPSLSDQGSGLTEQQQERPREDLRGEEAGGGRMREGVKEEDQRPLSESITSPHSLQTHASHSQSSLLSASVWKIIPLASELTEDDDSEETTLDCRARSAVRAEPLDEDD